ncbi:unnamed protein product, partial [Medioppia subpectinata]
MIWQSESHIIVMLTKVFDFIRVMCAQYWPQTVDSSEIYGQFEVTLIDEEKTADYVIRTIKLKFGPNEMLKSKRSGSLDSDSGEYRIIYQLHYHNWSANSCPFSDSILRFRKRVKLYCEELRDINTGPLIVHCSDGCGRTGAYICLDANLQLAEEEGFVDVYNYTKLLRESRRGMIESEKLMKMTSKLSIGECAGGHRIENRDKNRDVSIVP